ncbi:MAG: TetR/AcrR family transcriptional regulator [Proteobacteria bacterium]|nr:TetR/AcrR family transcriptional regulator [Pseudomonadota bacterium]
MSQQLVQKRRRGRDLVADLKCGARAVFGRVGYEDATVEDILVASQVSRHSFYRLFRSKTDLFDQLLEEHADDLMRRIRGVVATPEPPWEKLRLAVEAYLDWICELGPFFRVVASQYANPDSLANRRRRGILEAFARLIDEEHHIAFGDRLDPILVGAALTSIEHLGFRLLEDDEPAHAERIRNLAVFVAWRVLAPHSLLLQLNPVLPKAPSTV